MWVTLNMPKILINHLFYFNCLFIAFAQSDSIKTHEYNFSNKAFFNISDDLTNESEFKLSPFDSLEVGTYYPYPDQKVICSLCFVGADGITDFEGHQEGSSYEKIGSNTTSQGFKTYIFKDSNEYDVFIDLNNLIVTDGMLKCSITILKELLKHWMKFKYSSIHSKLTKPQKFNSIIFSYTFRPKLNQNIATHSNSLRKITL